MQEAMLAAGEVMLAAVQTFACLSAAPPSLPFCVPAWGVNCCGLALLVLVCKMREADTLTERP